MMDSNLQDAISSLRSIGEETVLAGLPAGDRHQTLANVRAMRRAMDDLAIAVNLCLYFDGALPKRTVHVCRDSLNYYRFITGKSKPTTNKMPWNTSY